MARLPNVSRAVKRWQVPVIHKVVNSTSLDFVDTETMVTSEIKAMAQASDINKINIGTLDKDLAYFTFHTLVDAPLDNGEFIEFKGKNYRLFGVKDHSEYGYYKGYGEEYKKVLA